MKTFQQFITEEINWSQVKDSAINAAKDIHGEPDIKIIDSMIEKIKKDGNAKDTEDAIQIIVDMMRS